MKTLILLVGVIALASGTPVRPLRPTRPISDIDHFKNFTVPTCTTRDTGGMRIQNGMIDTRYRWRNFNVHPDRAYNDQERQAINDAMYNLMQVVPCIEFGIWPPEANPSGDYVRIIKGSNNGCSSYVGRLGNRQDMNLQSPGCMGIGTIMHEMIHALGFFHEQSRPDRDDFVNIHWGNITPGMEYNFDKLSPNEVTSFGVGYNHRSIMHYNSHDFSRNGQATITGKNGEPVGSTGQLMDTDIRKLRLMYNC